MRSTPVLVLALLVASPAAAQTHVSEIWRSFDGAGFSLRSTYTDDAHGTHTKLELDRVQAAPGPATPGQPRPAARAGAPRTVYDGDVVMATMVPFSHDAAAVITWTGGAHTEVAALLVDLRLPATDAHAVRRVALRQHASAGTFPLAAIGCVRDGNVVVIWSEVSGSGPGGGASGYLARIAPDGTIVEAARTVAIPWSLAAIASNGADGYWLAVRYDGAGPDQTRLCLVRLDANANPTEHPWWAARPNEVGDAQLTVADDGPTIVYLTHQGVLASTSHTGGWGQEAHESRHLAAHGPIAAEAMLGVTPAPATH